jgi:Cu-processing system ATP-binding protein
MIDIRNLNKSFGKLTVLDDVNLTCESGECIALIGPNGCGKTTLIKSILGMVVPDSGEIRFDGKQVKKDYRYREQIGYMPQIGRYPDNMSIGQIFETIREIRHYKGVTDDELLKQFGLDRMFGKRMRTLSGGTTQKVSASLAFLFNPEVLILDEPTAGLDPLASEILKEKIIAEKGKGKLILITSHLLSELDDLITRIIFMQDGKVQFHLPVEELLSSTSERRISGAIAKVMRDRARDSDAAIYNQTEI